jgi:hypothetical protein
MEDINIDIESNVTSDEFINELYEIVMTRNHRTVEEGVYPSDFLYDMFFCSLDDQTKVWWMEQDHPISQMLKQNNYIPESLFAGKLGCIVVYSDEHVKACRDCILMYCEQMNKKIIKNNGI